MKSINDLIALFSREAKLQTAVIKESYTEAIFIFENVEDFIISDKDQIEVQNTLLSAIDNYELKVTIGNNDPVVYAPKQNNVQLFIDSLTSELEYKGEDDKIFLELKFVKDLTRDYINVFYSKAFFNYLNALDFTAVLYILKELSSIQKVINFRLLEDGDFKFKTSLLSISSNTSSDPGNTSKAEILNSLSTSCHTTLDLFQDFIPNDFEIEIPHTELKDFSNTFEYLKNVLSIAYLFDITSIDVVGDVFYTKLNGYRSFIFEVSLSSLLGLSLEQYFQIYLWVYDKRNVSDKLGLARNVISLYLQDNSGLELKQNLLTSLNSGYQIYLKDNIKQYIEIRNKISEQLIEFNKKANSLIEDFASGFQKSALAVVTFYVSAIALRVLGKDDHECIFSHAPTLLALGILAGSLMYFFSSRWDISEQRKRFVNSYNNMKERYSDLLESNDINRILNNDKEFNADIQFINDKMVVYSRLWISVIIIFTFITLVCFLSCYIQTFAKLISLFSSANCKC